MNKERLEYHKAVLSSRVIKFIIDSQNTGTPQSKDQYYSPLRSLCIDVINNYKPEINTHLQSDPNSKGENCVSEIAEAKKFMLAYFIGGVWIHQMYCQQSRFGVDDYYKSQILKFGYPIQDYLDCPGEERFKKIVFCPTHVITAQLFQKMKMKISYFLLYGQPGIGKSYAFVLYRCLSEIIFRYKYNYPENAINPSEIDFKISKYIYFSLSMKSYQPPIKKYINMTISSQCFLKYESFNKKDLEKDFTERLMELYDNYRKLGIPIRFGVDQANTMAALMNEKKELLARIEKLKIYIKNLTGLDADKKKKKELEEYIRYIKIELKYVKNILKKYEELIKKFIKSFKNIIYLSSIDIELELLKELNLNAYGDHYVITKFHVDYEKFFENPSLISDNLELIITILEANAINLKKYLPNKNEDSYKLTKEENDTLNSFKYHLKYLFKRKYFPITLLSIGQTLNYKAYKILNVYNNPKIISHLNNQKNLVEFVINELGYKNPKNLAEYLIILIFEKNMQILKDGIEKFINSEQQPDYKKTKSLLLLQFLYAAKAKLIKKKKNSQQTSDNSFSIKLNQKFTSKVYYLNKIVAKKLFFYYEKTKSYVLSVHIEMLESILADLYINLLDKFMDNIPELFELLDGKSLTGGMLESVLRHVMGIKNTILEHSSILTGRASYTFKFKDYPQNFYSIPKINDKEYFDYDFLKSFYYIIKQSMENNKNLSYYFEPVKVSKNKSEYIIKKDGQSKSIDFIICNQKDNKTSIHAYDVTVSQSKTTIKYKVMNILFDYSNFKDNAFRYYPGPQISYSPYFYYNVITTEKHSIDWKDTIETEMKKLSAEKEAVEQALKNYKLYEKKKIYKYNRIKMITNAYYLLKNLEITQIPGSNSFSINRIYATQSGSGLAPSPTPSKIVFKGVEVVSFAEKITVSNIDAVEQRTQYYIEILKYFKYNYEKIGKSSEKERKEGKLFDEEYY